MMLSQLRKNVSTIHKIFDVLSEMKEEEEEEEEEEKNGKQENKTKK